MKTNKVNPFAPSTLDGLVARREQLQKEADIALILLEHKAGTTFQESKDWIAARTSVPAAITALAAAGAQHLAGNATRELAYASWPVEVQRSLRAYDTKTEKKWTAFLPLVVKAAMEYNEQQEPSLAST